LKTEKSSSKKKGQSTMESSDPFIKLGKFTRKMKGKDKQRQE